MSLWGMNGPKEQTADSGDLGQSSTGIEGEVGTEVL